jgi:hypothetical protein
MIESPLERLQKDLYSGPEFIENPAMRAKEAVIDRNAYRSVLKDLGEKYGVIPLEVADEAIKEDLPEPTYLGNSYRMAGKYVNNAIKSLTRQFSKDGAVPYYWNKLRVAVADLPGMYFFDRNGNRKKLQGVLGQYIPDKKLLVMDKSLVTDNYVGADDRMKESVARHELYHSAQDEDGTIAWALKNKAKPVKTIEGEATIYGGGEESGVYPEHVRSYRKEYGNMPLTNFRGKMREYREELSNYIQNLFAPPGPAPAMAYAYVKA